VGGKLELELELVLGLAQDRQDLCDRLEARNGLRERDRWKVLDGRWTDVGLEHKGGG
jgi:hypothetical protein